jgi:CDP-glucose 4,6-dehydratase
LHRDGTAFAEASNFGPRSDDIQPVEWIVRKLAALWGEGASWHIDAGEHPHEATFLKLDSAKAAHRLHWQPVLDLDRGLQLTIDWTRGLQRGNDLRALTLSQITTYQAHAVVPATG